MVVVDAEMLYSFIKSKFGLQKLVLITICNVIETNTHTHTHKNGRTGRRGTAGRTHTHMNKQVAGRTHRHTY